MEILLATRGGNEYDACQGLRPIVSIDLEKSNCKITKGDGESGEVIYNLSWNN